jgi:hypothetical protein
MFVDAEQQLVVAKVSSEGLPLDAARITLTLRAVSALRSALAGQPLRQTVASHGCLCRGNPGGR